MTAPTRERKDRRSVPPVPGFGPRDCWQDPDLRGGLLVDPDLSGEYRYGYRTFLVPVYETREVLLPDMYRPRLAESAWRPIDLDCSDCGAVAGVECFDLRAPSKTKHIMRPHWMRRLVQLTGPARLVRWPVYTYPEDVRPGEPARPEPADDGRVPLW